MKRFLKISRRIVFILIATILFVLITIQTDWVQNRLVGYATKKISNELGTEVSIKSISISFFNKMNIEGFLVRDKKKDTLLYAGALKVRITDWFFLRDKAELKYVGLEDAIVKLQRKDSVWNYQYIADYLSASKTSHQKKSEGIAFNLKKIDLKNISFLRNDEWRGERIQLKVMSLVVDADKIDFNNNTYAINEIAIDKPSFTLLNMDGLRPNSLRPRNNIDTGLQLNPADIALKISKLTVHNGTLGIYADSEQPLSYFDGAHIFISKINGVFKNINLIKDTLRSDVELSAKERSGFDLKKLKTKYRVTPRIMEFAKLDILTSKSHVTDYYAMKYKHFIDDFCNYIPKVVMVGHIKDAKVNSDDIAFFAPELKSWKKDFTLTGDYNGTVDNFKVNNLFARSGNNTYVSGNFGMKGLPDVYKTNIAFDNGIVKTNYGDISIFVPVLKNITQPNFDALGNILFRGSFDGTINNFKTKGTWSTNLGGLSTDITMQIPSRKDATYTGSLTMSHFDLGKFLSQNQLGLTDFDGKISGKNFDLGKVTTNIEGRFSRLDFNGYIYSNITTNGVFQKKYFSGEVKVDDPNLNFTSQVEIDLTKQQPRFNILGDLIKSDLKPLNFSSKDILLTGLLDADFTGTNIDNFLGSAKFINANIKGNGAQISFDSLNLTSEFVDSIKILRINSNDFNASVSGKFNILDLPNSFQSFLHKYYPSYFDSTATVIKDQKFDVKFSSQTIDPYLQLLDKKISGFNDAVVTGSVDTKNNLFTANLNLPFARYGSYAASGIELSGNGNKDSLNVTGSIGLVQLNDSLEFPSTKFSLKSSDDSSVFSLKTSGGTTLNDADLNMNIYTFGDGVRLHFNPSSFVLNEKKWNLEKEGEITIRENLVAAQNVKFSQGFQEIAVETEADVGNNNLVVKLKDVVLGDITSFFMKTPRLEGITSGEVRLNDFFGRFNMAANLATEQFRVDDDSIGLVNVQSRYISKTGKVNFQLVSPNQGYNFSADGVYDVEDSSGHPLNTTIKLNNSKVDIVQRFVGDIFSNISGYATGNLTIKGNPNSPSLLGRVLLRNAGLKVNYTQVYYKIDSADIKFDEDGIDFGQFAFRDTFNNKGVGRGKLYEQEFSDINFDFDISTNKLLLLDTKYKDNQLFYGRAIGKASLSIKGPEDNCKMNIVTEPVDSSHIYIPNSVSRESGDADFIVFKQYGTDMVETKKESPFNLLVDLDITANNKAKIDVILDDITGDVIKAVGNGRLKIQAGTSVPFTMRGRYNIESGSYDFNFQSFIRKPFILRPDAINYIEWSGDPMNANIHIDAQYTADNVSVSDLLSSKQQVSVNSSTKAYRGAVYVIASLTNKLSKPTITFRLDFPPGSQVKNDATFNDFITQIEKDDNEMLKQVTYLIVFNSFAPYGDAGGTNNSAYTAIGVNTISQLVTKQISKMVSNVIKDKTWHVDLGTSFYNSSALFTQGINTSATNTLDRSTVNIKVAKSLFNDNIVVSFGGDFDFNLNASSTTTQTGRIQWLPDLNIEIVLTKDKKLRAIVFSKNSLDINGSTLGSTNKQGIGLSYSRDF